ncbi:DDE superfamily endonuclease [Methylosinus sp. sav-2]|nr:DDE superfamily endonuclease [Methylosinus sp. sav-2]
MDDAERGRSFQRTPFDRENIVLCVRWYLRYKLSFRDLVEMMAERGLLLAHTTIMRWVQRYVPEFEKRWNRFARRAGGSWRVDETYVKIKGRWVYLYRASTRGKDRGFFAAREARCRRRQSVFPSCVRERRTAAAQNHARRISGVTSGGARTSRTASRWRKDTNSIIEIPEKSDRTGSPIHQASFGADARVQAIPTCGDHDRRRRTHASHQEESIRSEQI